MRLHFITFMCFSMCTFVNTIFYKVDLEISNNPKIFRILAYLSVSALKNWQEIANFWVAYLEFPYQPYKK